MQHNVTPNASFAWDFGEHYAEELIGNFNSGMNTFLDWNVLLDEKGGPNHVGNFCSAPVIFNALTKELLFQPSYCFIGHFSRYIVPGSRRIAQSSYNSELKTACFITPDNTCIAVVLNQLKKDMPLKIKDVAADKIASIVVPAKSIEIIICKDEK